MSKAALASVLMKVHFVLFVLKFASVGKRDTVDSKGLFGWHYLIQFKIQFLTKREFLSALQNFLCVRLGGQKKLRPACQEDKESF